MSKHFKDALEVKERKASKTFAAPTQARATTGYFMAAGDSYGVGHRNPIGTEKQSSESPIPQKAFAFTCAEAIR